VRYCGTAAAGERRTFTGGADMTRAGVATWGAVLAVVGSALAVTQEAAKKKDVSPVLDFTMKNIDGQDIHLGSYQGDVLLLVNVASECGYTPQYDGLEKAFRKYKDRGFKVLAFPANNFGAQEPGTNAEIKKFCSTKYDVTFDIFSKVSVKGDDKCPLYAYLTDKQRNGSFGGESDAFAGGALNPAIGKIGPRQADSFTNSHHSLLRVPTDPRHSPR
jgi:glutathione peroxidase